MNLFRFKTIDGIETWEDHLNEDALADAFDALGKLRKAMNKIHGTEDGKRYIAGLTTGIECYLELLKNGERIQ